MRLCSSRFPCRRAVCPWCASRAARALRNTLLQKIDPSTPCLFLRLSLPSSHDLAEGWDQLHAARQQFGRKSWLTDSSTFWLRTTELTHGPEGWHWHDNYLVADPTADRDTIVSRWLAAAPGAAASAQYAEPARSTPAVRHYIAKGLMGRSSGATAGRTPGDLLADAYAADDLAADLWGDLEGFLESRRGKLRFTSRGGSLRNRKESYDLAA